MKDIAGFDSVSKISLKEIVNHYTKKDRQKLKRCYNILINEKRYIEQWFDNEFSAHSDSSFRKALPTDKIRVEFDRSWNLYDENKDLLNTCNYFMEELG